MPSSVGTMGAAKIDIVGRHAVKAITNRFIASVRQPAGQTFEKRGDVFRMLRVESHRPPRHSLRRRRPDVAGQDRQLPPAEPTANLDPGLTKPARVSDP